MYMGITSLCLKYSILAPFLQVGIVNKNYNPK